MSIEPITPLVQEDIQEHYTIYERELNENTELGLPQHILVTNDNLSNRIYFNMYYTFDDRELENKEISIVWINANNERGMSLAVDKTLDGDRLYFAWDVPQQATYKEGTVYFAVRIVAENYVWNSLAGTVEVHKGLVTEEFNNLEEAQLSPGWVDYIEGKYKISMIKTTLDEYNTLSTKDGDTLYLVTMDDGSVYQYLGDTLVSGGGTSNDGESVSTNSITVGYSSTAINGSKEAVDFDRDSARYCVYQLNSDTNTLTILHENITATDLKSKTFGTGGYYIFCTTPIQFVEDSALEINWICTYQFSSGNLKAVQSYVYTDEDQFPSSVTPDIICVAGSENIPYVDGSSGDSDGVMFPVGAVGFTTNVGDSYQYRQSGFVYSGCYISTTDATSWSADRTAVAPNAVFVNLIPVMKSLEYDGQSLSPKLNIGAGLLYDSSGNLCTATGDMTLAGKWSTTTRTDNVVSVTKPNYTTSTYDVYYNGSGTTLTRLHMGLSVSELATLQFSDSGNYYIFCAEPILYDPSYIVSSGFVAKFTMDADGIDVTPCQYLTTAKAGKISFLNSIRTSRNTQHYDASNNGTYATNCNCEYFHTSTSTPAYIFTGVKITKTGNCSYFQVDRSSIFTTDVTCYRKAITLICNNLPANYEDPNAGRIESLESTIITLQDTISSLETTINSLESRISALE